MEARTNLLDTVGAYRQRIEEAFAAHDGGPALQKYLQGWLADVSNSGGDESDPELPEANVAHRASIKSEEDSESNSTGRRRSINWTPPAHVASQQETDYSMVPPPPPQVSDYHAVNLPITVALILCQLDPTLDKNKIREELTDITIQNPDVDATMAAVQEYVDGKGFVFEKKDESFDKWKVVRQHSHGFYLLVLRLYLIDKYVPTPCNQANAHYYDHHALAYHGKFFRDHNTTSNDAFLMSSKASSNQADAERAYDSFFRSGRYKHHASYRHCALLNTWQISLKESAKRKIEEEMRDVKRRRVSIEEWSGGGAAQFRERVDKLAGGFVPISGEYTAIPDAAAIVLHKMNISSDDMPKSLHHDHWLESVKKYMKMPMTRYLNSKGLKLWSLPQGTLNNHLNILRQQQGNVIVILSLHFLDDKHGPVPRKTHAMVWLAKERQLVDPSARNNPTKVIDRDLKTDFTAKRVFDAILQQQQQIDNRVFKGSVVRSAYEIIPMTEEDKERYKEGCAAKEKAFEERKRIAEEKKRLAGLE